MAWFDGFAAGLHRAGEIDLFARTGGNAASILATVCRGGRA